MATAVMRLNQVQPGLEPNEMAARYQASIDMAAYGDANGFAAIGLEEHHGAPNGWSPSPLITAGLIFGRCPRVRVHLSALLVPLHDPLRIAEDIAVLDLASGGRFSFIAGLGYRPEEYESAGKDFARRGALMDECLDAMFAAWTGEPFQYQGRTARVTPRPLTQPHPPMLIGGTSKVSARRAARLGLPFAPAKNLPELGAYYEAQCARHGTTPALQMPPPDVAMVHVAEDPEAVWAKFGHHMLHEATTYAGWQTPDIQSSVHSHATTVEELRAEGIYRVLTPDQIVERVRTATGPVSVGVHPLVGGMPIDEAWRCVHLFVEQVLPRLP